MLVFLVPLFSPIFYGGMCELPSVPGHGLMAVKCSVCTEDFIQLHCFIVSRSSQKISIESSGLAVAAADI